MLAIPNAGWYPVRCEPISVHARGNGYKGYSNLVWLVNDDVVAIDLDLILSTRGGTDERGNNYSVFSMLSWSAPPRLKRSC